MTIACYCGHVFQTRRSRERSCRRPAEDTVAYPPEGTSASPTPHGMYATQSPHDDDKSRPHTRRRARRPKSGI
jgi:hypothetical protein